MPRISVIVPVYKVEQYLDKCVKSIVVQTFTDFELILIDDGSPDNCGVMCDEWAKKDDRIIVIHKENGGLSSARNAGIDISHGEYIGFVDSDDYIEPDMLEHLYNLMQKYNADIASCGVNDCYEGYIDKQRERATVVYDNNIDAIEDFLQSKYSSIGVTDKLFIKGLFNGVEFPIGKRCEDIYILAKVFLKSKTTVFDTKVGYNYVHRQGSITTDRFNDADFDAVEACKANKEMLSSFKQLHDVLDYRIWWAYRTIINKLSVLDKKMIEDSKKYIKLVSVNIRKDIYKIITCKYIYHLQRPAYILIAFAPKLYMRIYKKKLNSRLI